MKSPPSARFERWWLGVALLLAPALLGMKGEPFRYARAVNAAPGFAVLELPDDVLAAARPGLPDLRLNGPEGELAYVFEDALAPFAPPAPSLTFYDVETRPGRETTALLDRGPTAARCAELRFELAGDEAFLKPLVLEASPDGKAFAQLAKASIFRVSSGSELVNVRFPETDRRYLRVRFDDTNGPPVTPLAAACREPVAPAVENNRKLTLAFERKDTGAEATDTFVVKLPSERLPVVELDLSSEALAFSREVNVYEPVLFREELSRRLVGSAELARSATGSEQMSVPIGQLSGSTLELVVERQGSPLTLSSVTAVVEPRRLVFVAPASGKLELLYGSESAPPAKYDLGAAFGRGRPRALATAKLGPAVDRGAPAADSAPVRGPVLAAQAWKCRVPIELPARGNIAYLDLATGDAARLAEVRVVDAERRQVPFLIEAKERSLERPANFTTKQTGNTTTLELSLDPLELVTQITLAATEPAYFERNVEVSAAIVDRRGPVGKRSFASGRWLKRPDSGTREFSLPVAISGEPRVEVTITNEDNPPLVISKLLLSVSRRRIDFAFTPGDRLELWSGNPDAVAPRYDFELIAASVLSSPAAPARLAPPPAGAKPAGPDGNGLSTPAPPGTPRWFWWVVVGAGLLVVLALVRVGR